MADRMRWKYILCSVDGRDVPILFPSVLHHKHVFEAMERALRRSQLDDGLKEWPGLEPVAAGFVSEVKVTSTHGDSESMGIATLAGTTDRINAAVKP